MEKIRIGGSEQWILERSENVGNPVILYLHGGPGTSQLTSNRRDTKELEKCFTVVNWDQRGAGKSYDAIREVEKMNIDQFVEDTRELTLYLLNKFRKEKIILVGHSWGSVIGALTAYRYPELYCCYVGIGQVVNFCEGEKVSYEWTLSRAREQHDRHAVRALDRMGPPPYKNDWRANTMTQRRLLGRFGGEWHGSKIGAFGYVARNLVLSREYTVLDRVNFFKGILGSMRILWPQLMKVDLFQTVPSFKVPVFFMEGRFDYESPSTIAAKYYESIQTPRKELIWFENSAHLPNAEERELFNQLMVEKVLPVAMASLHEGN